MILLLISIAIIKHLHSPATSDSMRAFRACSATVIRCFKNVEAFADWLTGAAGPFFVGFCWSLIVLGGVAFCKSNPSCACIRSTNGGSRHDSERPDLDNDDPHLTYPLSGTAQPVWAVFLRIECTPRIPFAEGITEITPSANVHGEGNQMVYSRSKISSMARVLGVETSVRPRSSGIDRLDFQSRILHGWFRE